MSGPFGRSTSYKNRMVSLSVEVLVWQIVKQLFQPTNPFKTDAAAETFNHLHIEAVKACATNTAPGSTWHHQKVNLLVTKFHICWEYLLDKPLQPVCVLDSYIWD